MTRVAPRTEMTQHSPQVSEHGLCGYRFLPGQRNPHRVLRLLAVAPDTRYRETHEPVRFFLADRHARLPFPFSRYSGAGCVAMGVGSQELHVILALTCRGG